AHSQLARKMTMRLRNNWKIAYCVLGTALPALGACTPGQVESTNQVRQPQGEFPANIVQNAMQAGEARQLDDNGLLFDPLWNIQAGDPGCECIAQPGFQAGPGNDPCCGPDVCAHI